ncbi:Succinate dehydrogenase hydrophobic membrane anchor subunit [invertebrate metagenome]|uniref:Succinate dehydrogenase hydrophobic membrane anchor subunit n=1 Tax=invertebrate metagenome TaxID=1711999 RepID=A0A2H9TBT8_9ZZZZ
MVNSVTNLTRSGLCDWLVQRVTAVFLGLYTLFIVGYVITTPSLDYGHWKDLFGCFWMQVATMIALLSLLAHAWIGMWTITTDYLNTHNLGRYSLLIRLPVQLLCLLALIIYLLWGIQIIWGL